MSNWQHTIEGVAWDQYRLHERETIFAHILHDNNITPEQPPFCVAWEDPADLDAPVRITTPSPMWWAMALHGGILPPVEAYHELAEDEAQPGFQRHTRGYLLHDSQPMPPMTPEQAMIYLIQKDIPPRVWRDYTGNRSILRIIRRTAVPTDRSDRNAWRLNDLEAAA